jgi:(1->4)-alpha-D-glucan 1-alpha-D-glucosylmutase
MVLTPSRIPLATYRLQFSSQLRFRDARRLVRYLSELGISDAYPSPLFRAREHSSHGYDVIDPRTIDPEFGTEADFQDFAEELREYGLGLMMDVVPNHMGIDDWHNTWWQDVLENGMSSNYAKFFDIDWYPPKESLREKVLLPILGDQYGKVLENQEIKLLYEERRFRIAYYERRFPVEPRSWQRILRPVVERVSRELPAENPERMELESIVTAIENLPPRNETDPERIQTRYREKEVILRRFAALFESSPGTSQALEQTISECNGRRGNPLSFDRLEQLLTEQVYRLCYWRVATDEINYRRFFDINALAAIRVECPEVFEAVHALIFRLLAAGWVTALRIDHPDGLWDPKGYFENLQAGFREAIRDVADPRVKPPLYLAVEKILAHDEALDPQWPVCGTTGYDFLNLLNGLFVDRRGYYALRGIYSRFTGQSPTFADVLYHGKRTILTLSMSSELFVLARQLDRISEQHRWSRDYTQSSLRYALREVIAGFPVYRTYIGPESREVNAEDRRRILAAVRAAKRRNAGMSPQFFDFVGSVLLLEDPEGITDAQRHERRQFVLKFQQVTGPVMAKGMEDTAFYRYYPLASLSEVGGDPSVPGTSVEEFHRTIGERMRTWPYAMLATATHDTKRGEDTRARLNVLSEVPEEWEAAIRRWQAYNESHRSEIEGETAPAADEEYLLYQTLVATWPLSRMDGQAREDYAGRILQYMIKALRESKLRTSWANPDQPYEEAVERFIRAVSDAETAPQFLADLDLFVRSIADAGFVNSLAQVLVKICSPGVADFYQGTELWDFSLVDPDNRRSVDFDERRRLLAELKAAAGKDLAGLVDEILGQWPNERIKLFLVWRALEFRREHADLILHGRYLPLAAEGSRADRVCAFAREHDGNWALTVVPRLSAAAFRHREPALVATHNGQGRMADPHGESLAAADQPPASFLADYAFPAWWGQSTVRLESDAPSQWRDAITGQTLSAVAAEGGGRALLLADVFARFPVGLLESIP